MGLSNVERIILRVPGSQASGFGTKGFYLVSVSLPGPSQPFFARPLAPPKPVRLGLEPYRGVEVGSKSARETET